MLYTFSIGSTDRAHIKTELLYALAEAKATGNDLVRILYTDEEGQGRILDALLRPMKKQRVIDLFVRSDELDQSTTPVSYLRNKYEPELALAAQASLPYYIIRL